MGILAGLERRRSRLARLGIELRCAALPVVYEAIEPALRAAVGEARPDAILHLGLAGRRRAITIETRALNRANPLHPDAARRLPGQVLAPSAPQVLGATFPAARVRAALAREGHDARLSIDAGDYVCNATLYGSLLARAAPVVGFVHVPRTRERAPLERVHRRAPSVEALVDAVMEAILVTLRRADPHPRSGGGGPPKAVEGAAAAPMSIIAIKQPRESWSIEAAAAPSTILRMVPFPRFAEEDVTA